MKINLYDLLGMVGNSEVSVFERLETGNDRPLFIGYPEELQEHLELSFSTFRYKVFFMIAKDNLLVLTVVEE